MERTVIVKVRWNFKRASPKLQIHNDDHYFEFCLSFQSVANRPNFLGLFGQGLYDFLNGFLGYGNPSSGGGTSGSTSGAVLADQQSGGNNERPVYEVNVPDTIQALVR